MQGFRYLIEEYKTSKLGEARWNLSQGLECFINEVVLATRVRWSFLSATSFSRRIKANRLVITIFTFTKSNILCVLDNTTSETRYYYFFLYRKSFKSFNKLLFFVGCCCDYYINFLFLAVRVFGLTSYTYYEHKLSTQPYTKIVCM